MLVKTPMGTSIPLGQLAEISMTTGPAMVRNEDAQIAAYVYVDTATSDIGGYVDAANAAISRHLKLPTGYTLHWTGQYEFQVRARERLTILVPLVFFIIFMLLYMTFHSASEAHDRRVVMASLVPIMWSTGVGSDVMKPIAAPITRALQKGTLRPSLMTH